MADIFADDILDACSWMKTFEFQVKLKIEICSVWSDWQITIIGSDNGLSPYRPQAIIWTIDGIVCWRIYASLGLNELNRASVI